MIHSFGSLALRGALLPLLLSLTLIPVQAQDFVWARQIGGASVDSGRRVVTDAAGNVYVTGAFQDVVDFDLFAAVVNLTSSGEDDVFVAKLDSAGNSLWARKVGTGATDRSHDLAVDAEGNVYATGDFGSDAFVLKLDSNGALLWTQQIGGTGSTSARGVAVDPFGNVYVTGGFSGKVDFNPNEGVSELTSVGSSDVFLLALNDFGGFVSVWHAGGTGQDVGTGVCITSGGQIFTAGSFEGTADFNRGGAPLNLTSAGQADVYMARIDGAASAAWALRAGGTGNDFAQGIAPAEASFYVTGSFADSADFGSDVVTSAGGDDVFVAKVRENGIFLRVDSFGGTGSDTGYDVALDDAGNVFVAGSFEGVVDFDPQSGLYNVASEGMSDIFLTKLDDAGALLWANRIGGAEADEGYGVSADGDGNVYLTGGFQLGADFDFSGNAANMTSAGGTDVFVAKYRSESSAGLRPVITEKGIVMANLLPTINKVSPLSIISIFGSNFSTQTILFPNLDGAGKIATVLGGTCVLMNGEELPIFAMTPTQINAQVSATKAYGPASFSVVSNCGTTEAMTSSIEMATVEAATPAFFIFNPVAVDGFVAARFNASDSQPPVPVAPVGSFPNDSFGPSRPAKRGDIVVIYGTGFGETEAGLETGQLATSAAPLLPGANVTVNFGGGILSAGDVLYVGATPQSAGLYQVVIRIPANAQPGKNAVTINAYGKSSPFRPVIPVAAP